MVFRFILRCFSRNSATAPPGFCTCTFTLRTRIPLLPETLASVSFWFVLVYVRDRIFLPLNSIYTIFFAVSCVYLAWKHLRRRVKVTFQESRPAFQPRTRPCNTHAARSRCDISGQSTRFFTTNTALRAVKEAKEHDESHVDFARQIGKSPLTASAVLHCVYLAWKHPRRRIEVTFQVSRPAFPPQTRPCVRSKRLRSAMNRTLTSLDRLVSPHSQRAQFSIAFGNAGGTEVPNKVVIFFRIARRSRSFAVFRAVDTNEG